MDRTAEWVNENRRIVLSLPGLYSVLLYGLYIGSFNCLIFKKEVKTP
jgi:hypothetical protein